MSVGPLEIKGARLKLEKARFLFLEGSGGTSAPRPPLRPVAMGAGDSTSQWGLGGGPPPPPPPSLSSFSDDDDDEFAGVPGGRVLAARAAGTLHSAAPGAPAT
jgi:hypothetical protein